MARTKKKKGGPKPLEKPALKTVVREPAVEESVDHISSDEVEADANRRALLTIERLAKKYLDKSPNMSANSRGVLDIPSATETDDSSADVCPDAQQTVTFPSNTFSPIGTQKSKPKRLARRRPPLKQNVTPMKKSSTTKPVIRKLSSVRVGKAIVHVAQSTPARKTPGGKENSLYELQTPCGISPVVSEMEASTSEPQAPEYTTNVKGTKKKKNPSFCQAEVQKWVSDLNQHFDEVDQYELAIE